MSVDAPSLIPSLIQRKVQLEAAYQERKALWQQKPESAELCALCNHFGGRVDEIDYLLGILSPQPALESADFLNTGKVIPGLMAADQAPVVGTSGQSQTPSGGQNL